MGHVKFYTIWKRVTILTIWWEALKTLYHYKTSVYKRKQYHPYGTFNKYFEKPIYMFFRINISNGMP